MWMDVNAWLLFLSPLPITTKESFMFPLITFFVYLLCLINYDIPCFIQEVSIQKTFDGPSFAIFNLGHVKYHTVLYNRSGLVGTTWFKFLATFYWRCMVFLYTRYTLSKSLHSCRLLLLGLLLKLTFVFNLTSFPKIYILNWNSDASIILLSAADSNSLTVGIIVIIVIIVLILVIVIIARAKGMMCFAGKNLHICLTSNVCL